jgi:hypothetical protein
MVYKRKTAQYEIVRYIKLQIPPNLWKLYASKGSLGSAYFEK